MSRAEPDADLPSSPPSDAPESESLSRGDPSSSDGGTDDGVPTIVIRRSDHDDDVTSAIAGPVPTPVPAAQQTFVSGGAPSSGAGAFGAPSSAPPSEALQRALQKLREVFHIRELRPGQAEIMESVLAGQDTLAIMPTGSGK